MTNTPFSVQSKRYSAAASCCSAERTNMWFEAGSHNAPTEAQVATPGDQSATSAASSTGQEQSRQSGSPINPKPYARIPSSALHCKSNCVPGPRSGAAPRARPPGRSRRAGSQSCPVTPSATLTSHGAAVSRTGHRLSAAPATQRLKVPAELLLPLLLLLLLLLRS